MRHTWTTKDFENLEKRQRAMFINSLSGAKSANLAGSVDIQGQTNLSMVSSCVHLGANPALMAMVIRPRAVSRHTMDNLEDTGFWTLNHITPQMARAAHQTSARYPKEVSEFEAVGFKPVYLNDFKAPFVDGAPVQIGLRFLRKILIQENDTELVIGQIEQVHFDGEHLLKDGSLSLARTGTVAVTGLDHYHELKSLFRLSYAKPDKELSELDI